MNFSALNIALISSAVLLPATILIFAFASRRSSESGKLSHAQIVKLTDMLERMNHSLLLPASRDGGFRQIVTQNWLAQLGADPKTHIAIHLRGDNSYRVESGVVADPIAWIHEAKRRLAHGNFLVIDGHSMFSGSISSKKPFILFEVKEGLDTQYNLVQSERYLGQDLELLCPLFSRTQDLIATARLQTLDAIQFQGLAEGLQTRNSNFWRVLQTVSHNVRGTLAPMILALSVIEEDITDEDRAARQLPEYFQDRYFENISHRIAAGERLLNSMAANIALLLEDQVAIDLVDVNLERLFVSNFKSWIRREDEKRDAVDFSFAIPSTIWIRVDPNAFFQVVWNVLRNAIQYTRQGKIEIWAERNAEMVSMMVKDTGPGIAPEDIARIGEFGHRGSTTRDIVPGEGVGLWGVYRYMELMGGTVNIRSEVGKGTTFILSFQSVATDA